ncbi:P-loop NTPase fold protein [Streptomyces sp. NBUA17]|uniref:P-loop NTPase fold protein n=1 Tax=Streptomyces sp. NBUA17 TaxID=3062275 RepID=UPI0037DA278C
MAITDDLGRLAPEELLVVFKPVRLAGHLPNVYYPISTDEQTLQDVLQRTDPVGSKRPTRPGNPSKSSSRSRPACRPSVTATPPP